MISSDMDMNGESIPACMIGAFTGAFANGIAGAGLGCIVANANYAITGICETDFIEVISCISGSVGFIGGGFAGIIAQKINDM